MIDLPTLRLTWAEFKLLPEYSHSLPTGATAGKRWRRHQPYFDRKAAEASGPGWGDMPKEEARRLFSRVKIWIGEYGQPNGGGGMPVTWYRPIIICNSGEGLDHG
jgi:hypothetical protein